MSLEGPDSLTPGPIASVHLDMCLDQQHRWGGEVGGAGVQPSLPFSRGRKASQVSGVRTLIARGERL